MAENYYANIENEGGLLRPILSNKNSNNVAMTKTPIWTPVIASQKDNRNKDAVVDDNNNDDNGEEMDEIDDELIPVIHRGSSSLSDFLAAETDQIMSDHPHRRTASSSSHHNQPSPNNNNNNFLVANNTKSNGDDDHDDRMKRQIRNMLYGFGDERDSRDDTVTFVQQIVVTFVQQMVVEALSVGRPGKVSLEDVWYLIRRDELKYIRVKELLEANAQLKMTRKAFDDKNDALINDSD